MLELSDSALNMIARLRADARPGPSRPEADEADEAGGDLALRISAAGEAPGLTMTLTDAPAPDDVVLVDPRATVFLDPVAAVRLDGELLDARSDERGRAFFLGARPHRSDDH